ncbi:AAEL012550-PA [Aedes aegypti]|uniref:AAEL012550-PA n=1 Tax=Aedes aegypti TaxID=7159 RepID=Q16LR8_AEDAE|nr:AAEL012550-PA [Aedes aegypti]
METGQEVPKEIGITPDPNRQQTLDALRVMGANNPSLWTALYDVGRAIDASIPVNRVVRWETICGTAEQLYQMSFKDPREFAIAQTLMTVMHQEQTANRVLVAYSKVPAVPTKQLISSELREIRKEMGMLTDRVHDHLTSFGTLKERFEILKRTTTVVHNDLYDDRNSFNISREQLREVERHLTEQFGSPNPDVDVLLDVDYYQCTQANTPDLLHDLCRKVYARAKEFADPGVPTGVVVMINLLWNKVLPKNASQAFQKFQHHIHGASVCNSRHLNKEQLIRNSIRRSHAYCNCTMHR